MAKIGKSKQKIIILVVMLIGLFYLLTVSREKWGVRKTLITSDEPQPVCTVQNLNIQKSMVLSGTDGKGLSVYPLESKEAETPVTEVTFPFEELSQVEFTFCSGAGGWATILSVNADGTFSGEYFDGELGVTGEGYPNGTMYQSRFNGMRHTDCRIKKYSYIGRAQSLQNCRRITLHG